MLPGHQNFRVQSNLGSTDITYHQWVTWDWRDAGTPEKGVAKCLQSGPSLVKYISWRAPRAGSFPGLWWSHPSLCIVTMISQFKVLRYLEAVQHNWASIMLVAVLLPVLYPFFFNLSKLAGEWIFSLNTSLNQRLLLMENQSGHCHHMD